MTREQAREAAAVMLGWADGKEVQYLSSNGYWVEATGPNWKWYSTQFRLKPAPVLRPWTADEVPLGAWMRRKADNSFRSIITTTGDEKPRESWLNNYEHSTDGGLTWKPCGVEEVGK